MLRVISTFKIPHSLFALDAGILRDEFQVIPWDGVKHPIEAWNEEAGE
jgi:beta-lactamase class D